VDGYAEFVISLSNASSSTISLNLGFTDGTAAGLGTDYGSTESDNLQVSLDNGQTWADTTSLLISAGATTALARTPITDDALEESPEDFTFAVIVASGPTMNSTASGTATILDNDGIGNIVNSNGGGRGTTKSSSAADDVAPAAVDFLLAGPPGDERDLVEATEREYFGEVEPDMSPQQTASLADAIMTDIEGVLFGRQS
jgi:hypothetical protein